MKKISLYLFAFGFLVLFFGCGKKKPPERPPKNVQAATVICRDVPIYANSFGYLRGLYSVDIQSQVTGNITEVRFTQGQTVKKGDILFVIDKTPYLAQLAQAQAQLQEDLANLKLKKFVVDRDKPLFESRAISEQNYAKLVTEMNYTQAQVETDRAVIAETKVNLNYCDIRSPIDGITGIRKVDPGNIVPANTGPVLVNVRTVTPLYVDFSIPDRFLAAVRASMAANKLKVVVTANEVAFGINSYNGELRFINNSINNNSGTLLLRATVPNKDNRLWAGQFVKVRLIFFVEEGALLAPSQAVKIGKSGPYLFVIDKNNKAQLRLVKTWIPEGDYTVIRKGDLKEGDLVVTVGQMALAPGEKVRVIKNIDKELSFKPNDNTGKMPEVHIKRQELYGKKKVKKPAAPEEKTAVKPDIKKPAAPEKKTTVKPDKKKDAVTK